MCIQDRFKQHSILDVRTYFSKIKTLTPALLPGVRKRFIKGEALRPLRTNSSKAKFDEHIALFKQRLRHRGYPDNLLSMTLSEVNFSQRMSALQNKQKNAQKNFAVCNRIPPINAWSKTYCYEQMASYTKPALTKKNLLKTLSLFHIKKGSLLKDVLVRAKLWGLWISYPNQ